MPRSHLVLLSSKPFFNKQDLTPPSYATVTKGRSSPSRCSWDDPVFRIPKIEVNPPTPRKRGDPLLMGCYIPPMAPLEACLPRPTQTGTLSPMAMVIDLTDEPSMTSGGTSSAHPQSVQLESQMQVKMSGGTLVLRCKLGGRITSGAHDERRKESRWLGPVIANYQQSKEAQARRLKFSVTDLVHLQAWLTKKEPGEILPPQLVQTSQLMMHTGHIVQTMTAFVPWDSSLVDDGGRTVAESQTVDLVSWSRNVTLTQLILQQYESTTMDLTHSFL
jgi:hypothetical protein